MPLWYRFSFSVGQRGCCRAVELGLNTMVIRGCPNDAYADILCAWAGTDRSEHKHNITTSLVETLRLGEDVPGREGLLLKENRQFLRPTSGALFDTTENGRKPKPKLVCRWPYHCPGSCTPLSLPPPWACLMHR